MPDPTGVRNVEEAVATSSVNQAAASLTPHPHLIYDVDDVLRREPVHPNTRFVLGEHGDPACQYYFTTTNGVRIQLQFLAPRRGTYIVVPGEVRGALHDVHVGVYDHIELVTPTNRYSDVFTEPYYRMTIRLPRHSLTSSEFRAARDALNAFTVERQHREAQLQLGIEEREARERKVAEERAAAQVRAMDTLRRYLNPQQRRTLTRFGTFMVTGSKGTKFRIHCRGGIEGNVTWYDKHGHPMGKLCAHLSNYDALYTYRFLPYADHWLAQMLEITADEDRWLKIAHKLGGHAHPTQLEHWGAA